MDMLGLERCHLSWQRGARPKPASAWTGEPSGTYHPSAENGGSWHQANPQGYGPQPARLTMPPDHAP
jgi:hypothetical protein